MRKDILPRLACSVFATLVLTLVLVADSTKPAGATTQTQALRLCQALPGRCHVANSSTGPGALQICVTGTTHCQHQIHCPKKGQCWVAYREAPAKTGAKQTVGSISGLLKGAATTSAPKKEISSAATTFTRAKLPTTVPTTVPTTSGPTVPKPVVQADVVPKPTVPPTVRAGYIPVGAGKTYGVDPQRRK